MTGEIRIKLNYTKIGDYLLPNLALPEQENCFFGKYGRLRLAYLKNHKRVQYINLLTSYKLNEHLVEVDKQANEMLELLMKQMVETQGITEQLKAQNQMAWLGAINNIKTCAEEIILREHSATRKKSSN